MPATTRKADVSPNNPCHFLRALVSQAMLPDDVAGLGEISKTIVKTAKAGDGSPQLPAAAIRAIALIANGRAEPGLTLDDLKRMMDANFARAKGRRRIFDRRLMDGEWPILLKVMGKQGKRGRYLSVKEVRQLFVDRRLPQRMSRRLAAG